jgi:hypothetical protein
MDGGVPTGLLRSLNGKEGEENAERKKEEKKRRQDETSKKGTKAKMRRK